MDKDQFCMKSQASYKQIQESEKHQKFESILESFLMNTLASPTFQAIEETISITLNAATVTLWQDIPSLHLLHSPRLLRTCTHSSGLVGYTFFTREIVKAEKASTHSAYSEKDDKLICPGDTPVLLFPLWDYENNVCSVVEVTKSTDKPFFNEEDEDFILFFTKRFKVYSKWLFQTQFPHNLVSEIMSVMELEQFLLVFKQKIPAFFNCRKAEIWMYDIVNKKLLRYDDTETVIDESDAGITWEALIRECPLNCTINKELSSFNEIVDGEIEEPVLVVPVLDIKKSVKWGVTLRGHTGLSVFTSDDENMLKYLAPYLATALDNAKRLTESASGKSGQTIEHKCVTALSTLVDMIEQGDDLNKVFQKAVDSIGDLVDCDKRYLFQYDNVQQQYVSSDEKVTIKIDKDKGIVGRTFNEKKVFNIPDVMTTAEFDMSGDLQTGYKTKSLLSAPVLNNRKECVAVLQFLNKKDQKPFSNTDIKFAKIISSFAGLVTENEKMYNISTQARKEVMSLIKSADSMTTDKALKAVIGDIVNFARDTLNSDRASLFLHDKVVGVLTTYIVTDGELPQTIPMSHGIAASAVNKNESILINDAYHDPRFNKMIDFHTGYKTRNVIAVPISTHEEGVVGVIEVLNKNGLFTNEDVQLLTCYAKFCGLVIEKKRLKEVTERGKAQVEMSKWIGEYERDTYTIPFKLQVPEQKQKQIVSLDFYAVDWNGIGLFKIAFFVFNSFGLLERFKISNELFFTFLYRLRSNYNEPPYHNWIHAIDVLQYISYQVHETHADQILTHLELLAVCVGALCHDVGHEGYNNVFNVKAETPLGILFKNQSVMETYHCTLAIRIIKETNIFYSLTRDELVTMWKWIIHLILATDMAFHFKLIKHANEVLEQGALNLKEESDRLMAMELIMKVSDISNVSRPFQYADQWCEVLSEEFWRQGDLEKEIGIAYTGPLMNREGQNKAKGQVGFYTGVCLPLYTLIARLFPELKPNLDSVNSNLQHWKQLVAEQEAAATAANPDNADKSEEEPILETRIETDKKKKKY